MQQLHPAAEAAGVVVAEAVVAQPLISTRIRAVPTISCRVTQPTTTTTKPAAADTEIATNTNSIRTVTAFHPNNSKVQLGQVDQPEQEAALRNTKLEPVNMTSMILN